MKNNFVAKNDFNKSSVHKDLKNDYERSQNKKEVQEGLIYFDEIEQEFDYAQYVALLEYARAK